LECINNNETCTKCVSNKAFKDNQYESSSPCNNSYYENNNKVCTSYIKGTFFERWKIHWLQEGCAEYINLF